MNSVCLSNLSISILGGDYPQHMLEMFQIVPGKISYSPSLSYSFESIFGLALKANNKLMWVLLGG